MKSPSGALLELAKESGLPELGQPLAEQSLGERYAAMLVQRELARVQVAAYAGRTVTVEDADQAAALYERMRERAAAIIGELREGNPIVSAKAALELPSEMLQQAVLGMFASAAYVSDLHKPEEAYQMVRSGKMTAEELDDDFKRRLGIFQAINYLFRHNVLTPQAQGAGPAVGAGVLIAAVAALAVIAAAVVFMYATWQANRTLKDLCERAEQRGDVASLEQCLEIAEQNLEAAAAPSTLGRDMTPWIIGAVLLAAGIYFAPVVARSLKGAHKELAT